MDPMQAIRETFFQECEEQLGELETGLLAMEDGSTDTETVNAVFRAVHSIKGGAGAFKLDRLVRFAHVFETTLDNIRNGQLGATPAVMKTMLRAADVLADLVTSSREGGPFDEARSKELIAELNAHCEEKSEPKPDEPAEEEPDPFSALGWEPVTISIEPEINEYAIQFKPKPELYVKGNETTRLMREFARLGSLTVQCEIADVPPLANLDPEQSYLSWRASLRTEQDISAVQAVFEFVEGDCHLDIEKIEPGLEPAPFPEAVVETPPAAAEELKAAIEEPKAAAPSDARSAPREAAKPEAGASANATQNTIRVDLDRVDRLINLVGELVINQAMLTQRVLEAGRGQGASVAAGLDDLEHLTREIQESVMAIRAQPVRPLFQRMARIVREVADATGKNVRLKTEGEGAEVDRTVIERLADPLTHMIRNAVDHGLERPDARLARRQARAGRSAAVGRAQVRPRGHRGRRRRRGHRPAEGEVDRDQQGADPRRRAADRRRDRQSPVSARLFDRRDGVQHLRPRRRHGCRQAFDPGAGRPHLDLLAPGLGSTFSMSLPLTLAVLDGMVVKVADQTLVVPLTRSWRR